ncbi:UNVERIFIED_CONTAM: hypothetical protein RMT77_005559 [Armadillidium vulgare]
MPKKSNLKAFYYRHKKENENIHFFGITLIFLLILLLCVWVIITLYNIDFSVFERCFSKENHNVMKIYHQKFPLVPSSFEDVFNLLQEDDEMLCHQWEVIPPPKPDDGEDIQNKWRLGNSICKDYLPDSPTSSTCRIYSVKYDTEDMTFEMKKGRQGCRVHVWGNKTIYSYMKLGANVYFYPMDLDTISGPGVYSLDDFVGLMGHKGLKIHYLKSTSKGGHETLLRTFFASKSKLWENVEQIQFLLYLPKIGADTWSEIERHYKDIILLKSFGYKLARVRKDPRFLYTKKVTGNFDKEISFSEIYELVWIKPVTY